MRRNRRRKLTQPPLCYERITQSGYMAPCIAVYSNYSQWPVAVNPRAHVAVDCDSGAHNTRFYRKRLIHSHREPEILRGTRHINRPISKPSSSSSIRVVCSVYVCCFVINCILCSGIYCGCVDRCYSVRPYRLYVATIPVRQSHFIVSAHKWHSSENDLHTRCAFACAQAL